MKFFIYIMFVISLAANVYFIYTKNESKEELLYHKIKSQEIFLENMKLRQELSLDTLR